MSTHPERTSAGTPPNVVPLPRNTAANTAPYNEEAERALLGAVVMFPQTLAKVKDIVQPSDFFLVRHELIWAAIIRLDAEGKGIDYITIKDKLAQIKRLDDIGGPAYLTQLLIETPNTLHATFYAQIVRRAAYRRRIMQVADQIHAAAMDTEMPMEDLVSFAENKLHEQTRAALMEEADTMLQATGDYLDELEIAMSGKYNPYVRTGFNNIDTMLDGGLKRRELIVLAGRPGMGKSALVLSMAQQQAAQGVGVGVISNEMTVSSMTVRLLATMSGIPSRNLIGPRAREHYAKILEHSGRLSKLPIYMRYQRDLTLGSVTAWARRMIDENEISVLYIDGLYRMFLSDNDRLALGVRDRERFTELRRIAQYLTDLAKETDIPIVVTHQVGRKVEVRSDKRPLLSDLEYLGEQDADNVMLLYRPEYYDRDFDDRGRVELNVAKNRSGATGTVLLRFTPETTTFRDDPRRYT